MRFPLIWATEPKSRENLIKMSTEGCVCVCVCVCGFSVGKEVGKVDSISETMNYVINKYCIV
jgi:hypothetical protein